MLTKIDLCSMALLKLGEKPIQSLSEDTAVAKLGRTFIDVVIDELLAMHPWRFACQSYDLNAIPTLYAVLLGSNFCKKNNDFCP